MSTTELFEAFKANPTDHKAFEALVKHLVTENDQDTLGSLYTSLPEWAPEGEASRLFQILAQQARTAKDDDVASYLHYQNGLLLWKAFDSAQKAEMMFRKMKSAPSDPSLLREFYIDFYVEQDNWRRLEQFLSEPQMGGIEDPVECKRVLARLAEERGKPDKAVGFWQAVYTADPNDLEAEGALRRLFAEVGKWHAMVDLLKNNLGRLGADQVSEAIALHLEMIDIFKTHLNAASKVVGSWQAILELEPGNTQALDALAAEYDEMKRWPDLVKVLKQKIEHETETAQVIALHERVATIMLDKFNNSSEAIKSYEAILEIDPTNRKGIDVLKEIYESRHDWDSYIVVAEREVGLLPEGADRDAAYIKLAKLASERIRKPQTPIALWERVLTIDPDHAEALGELETLYEREKSFEDLARILDRRAELSDFAPDKVALLEKLGQVYSSRLEDDARAAEVWRRVLELDAEHRKAQAELKKKYTAERDWDNLEWFFRTYASAQDWVRTLESQAKSLEDPAETTTLLFKAAAVWQDELGDTRRAVKNLESVLEIEPRHAGAARMMVPIYREVGSWAELPNVYDIVLEATEDRAERQQLLLALAEVQEQHLSDVDSAFFAYVQAVQESPNAVSLHPELRRLAEASGNWDSYVMVLQETVDLIEDEGHKVGVLLEIGHVYRDHVGLAETALTFFNRVVELDDGNRAALAALEGLYRDLGAWDQLIVVYDKQLRIAQGGDERKETLFQLAAVWREALGQAEEAEAIYREMLDDFPDETRVHDALIAIQLEQQRWAPLREVLERKRDILAAQGAHAVVLADLECELGMLAYGVQPDAEGVRVAVDHYEAALRHDAQHLESVARLEELLADEDERLRITRILEPVYRDRAEWARLAEVFEIQLLAAAADEDVYEQVSLLERLADLYKSSLDDLDLAWRTYGRWFAHEPHRADVRGEFQRLTAQLERWPALIALYAEHAEEAGDPLARLAIKLEVARAYHRREQDLEHARQFYHKVLDEEPEHKEAIDALEGIYAALDRSEDLLDIYRRKIELSQDVEQKLQYLFRTSDLLRDGLGKHDEAVVAAREALDLVPGNMDALLRLDELYTATEQWTELAQILEDAINLVRGDVPRHVVYQTRLASLHETVLEDVATAISLYAENLTLEPEHMGTVEALERLFEAPEHAPAIAPILQPYYDRVGDWVKLIDVYTVREAASDDVFEKVDWRYKIADLYEAMGERPDAAFEHYLAAAALDPASEGTLSHLLRLADVLGNHGELVLSLKGLVDDIDDDYRRRETHRTIASLCRDTTHDVEGAEAHLRAILELDPGDMPAIEALVALYRQLERSDKLVEMLLVKAPMVGDMADKQALYAEAGELSATVLDAPESAIEIYETLHNLDTTGDLALEALEGLYERVEDWEQLIGVYRQKIERAADLDTRKYYASLMGHVQAGKQESLDDAVMTWRMILEWDPAELGALHELDGLYTRQEDWFNLLDVLQKMQALLDEAGWAEAQFRVAKLFEDDERLGDPRQAIAAYGELLGRVPGHEGAIASLEAIIESRDEREAAFEVLRPVLAEMNAFEPLWQQYEIIAAHQSDDPFRKVETLHQMAQLAEKRLFDATRAFEAQARAFELDRQHPTTVAELERLADEHEMIEALVALYAAGAEDTDDELLAQRLRLKTGALLMDRVQDAARATDVYKKIFEDYPDHQEVLSRLHALYEAQGQYEPLVEVLRQQIETQTEPAEKMGFLFKLAQVCEACLEDTDGAFDAYMEVLYLDEQSEDAIAELQRLYVAGVHRLDIAERLEPIYTGRGAWEELHGLLELKLEVLEDPLDRLQIMRQLAELNLERLGSKPEAIAWFGHAFRLDPEDEGLLVQLRTLAEETDRWDEVKVILMDGADAVQDDERRVELWGRAAAITRDRLGDIAEAERVYLLILGQDGENFPALQALDRIYVAAERWEDLEGVLAREADVAEFDDERMKLLVRLAELYRDRLGRREDAIDAWKRVLDINDTHGEALQALRTMYHEDENWPALFEILQQLSETTGDDAERAGYMADMAEIAEVCLGKVEDAINLWEDVLAVTPQSFEAVQQLQRLREGQEDWNGLVEAYERELAMGQGDAARRLDLFKRIGRTWQQQLEDGLQAQMYWEKARAEDAFDAETLEALHVIYRDNYAHEALAGCIEARLESGHYDVEAQVALWRELAELRTEPLGDRPAGIDAWRAVLELAPGAPDAIENLENLYESEERWADLVELYRVKLGYTEDAAQQIETWLHMASIQEERLQDQAAAAGTYVEILTHAPDNVEASQRLEAIYEAFEQWADLAQLLTSRNAHLGDMEDRLMNLQRLAGLYEHKLGQADGAFMVLESAIDEAPEEPHVLSELARLAELTGLWPEMLAIYDRVIEHLDPDAALDAMLKAAYVQRDKLQDPASAAAYFERVLEHAEDSEPALRALVDLNIDLEQFEKLVDVLQRLSYVTMDYQEKVVLLSSAAEVFEHNIGDRERAVGAYEAICEVDESNREALGALERLHTERGDWRALIDVLERVSRVEPQRESELKLRVAQILEGNLGEIDEAIGVYEDVLAVDPNNAVAIEALQGIYGERNDWAKLVDVFERSYGAATNDEQRVEACRNIALLQQEVFKDAEQAAEAFQRILYIVPDDAEAIEALERIFAETSRWDDLVDLYEKKRGVAQTAEERAQALMAMAAVYRDQIGDLDSAIGSYERALSEAPGHRPALDALRDLYREQGLWEQLIGTLDRTLAVESGHEERLALHCEQGSVRRDELNDAFGAAEHYKQALAEWPGHPQPVQALIDLYSYEERFDLVLETLEHKLQHAQDDVARADVHVELASLFRDKLHDEGRALEHLELSVQANPESEETLWPLADHYMATRNWTKAMPLLDVLVDKLDARGDRERLAQVHKRLGQCAEAVYDDDRALDEYSAAVEHASPDKETLRGLARLHFKKQNYSEALRYYQQVIDTYGSELSDEDFVLLYLNLGESALKLGRISVAQTYLSRVIQHQPNNAGAIERIVEVLEAHGDWAGAISYMQQLLALKSEPLAKFNIQLKIADIFRDNLRQPDKAVEAYQKAVGYGNFSKAPLMQLVQVHIERRNFDEAIRWINKIIEIEEDAGRKSTWAYTAAVTYRDEVGDRESAIKYLNLTLDYNIEKLEAFRAIDELLTHAKEWKPLEQNYRRMLQRVQKAGASWPKYGAVNFMLYRNLGEIYRSRLKRTDYAISAFELARKIKPDDEAIHEILAGLYESTPDQLDKAVEEHRYLIRQHPDRFDSYHKLVELYKRMKAYDKAWVMAGLLVALNRAEPDEERFYRDHQSAAVAETNRIVDATAMSQLVASQQEDPYLGQVFAILYASLYKSLPLKQLKEHGLKKKDRIDLSEGLLICSVINSVCRILGLQPPEVYRSSTRMGIEILDTQPPVLSIGPDMLQGKGEKDLAFHLARRLMYLTNTHIMAALFQREQLDIMFMAAEALIDPSYKLQLQADMPDELKMQIAQQVGETRAALDKDITPQNRTQLAQVIAEMKQSGRVPHIGLWHRQVELTAIHAALLVCDDVELAGHLLREEVAGTSKLKKADKLKDLVMYAMSDQYLSLRQYMGIQIEYSEMFE